MKYIIKEMSYPYALEISSWQYEKPYDFYNSEKSNEAIEEKLNGSYFIILDQTEEDILGFYCTGESAQVPKGNQYGVYAEDLVDVGLGMNPRFVGQGRGYSFVAFILEEIEKNNPLQNIRLTVATFNKRAIHLYQSLGFTKKSRFDTDMAAFIMMVKVNKR
ncbi:GNAT family N-acetyltransferase [Saliterribacillus persicus]|uniref:Acetyltransferase (GNAT) family protein n=1 Tax=Saliterribacillus persicus TaxID=930114 RepID=A0A368X791_9BACI|nr:GNAT family N-acetyltransferase [Saliterribacillus persicus]RCW62848.1 acetyltransferase (GNAT) family protein [Saliterribacillus persicus]